MGSQGKGAMRYDHGHDAEHFYLGLALNERYVGSSVEVRWPSA
jgi:hypothetical protein